MMLVTATTEGKMLRSASVSESDATARMKMGQYGVPSIDSVQRNSS